MSTCTEIIKRRDKTCSGIIKGRDKKKRVLGLLREEIKLVQEGWWTTAVEYEMGFLLQIIACVTVSPSNSETTACVLYA